MLTTGLWCRAAEEEDAGDWVMEVVHKTPEELTRIKAAVKANFLFQHLNDAQAKQVSLPHT